MTINRRDALKAMAAVPVAAALTWTREEELLAAEHVERIDGQAYTPEFFNAQEWRTVRVLVDDIIPKDERSGSATDAKVPEFMDFILNQGSQNNRTSMRNGLAWLDQESRKRQSRGYADLVERQRHLILEDIAWPAKAKEEFRANVSWFNSFRDMTASGFFSSRTGYKDLGYTGGTAIARWEGAPQALLQKLGVNYTQWDRKYGRGW